jgi:hypothetical protein
MKNYKNLSEITVKTQAELDAIPDDFKGRIYIESNCRIVVSKRYYLSVVAWENSSVIAWENSSVEARDNSSVVAWENSSVVARGNSSVIARENSSVEARDNSSVVAWENSSVEARGNSQIVDRTLNGKIKISGNARIVHMPKNINDFIDFYGIKHTKTKAIFYKAVHKVDGSYLSDHNKKFTYEIGKTVTDEIDTDVKNDCGKGLHISHLHFALDYGQSWNDIAILECETKISDIVMPTNTDGKVRTSKLKVLREVPLEECGVYGKILAKRGKKE